MAFSVAPASVGAIAASTKLERDDASYKRHPLDLFDLGMVSAQTRAAVAARESEAPGAQAASGVSTGQFVICAVCSAWLNIAFSAAAISVGEFAV